METDPLLEPDPSGHLRNYNFAYIHIKLNLYPPDFNASFDIRSLLNSWRKTLNAQTAEKLALKSKSELLKVRIPTQK